RLFKGPDVVRRYLSETEDLSASDQLRLNELAGLYRSRHPCQESFFSPGTPKKTTSQNGPKRVFRKRLVRLPSSLFAFFTKPLMASLFYPLVFL
ncbi:hypothetical protein LZ24_03462, partial [Desulfobotulus alkaliphilus]